MSPDTARAPLKKTIDRCIDLHPILLACHRHYLEILSALDDFSTGDCNLHRITSPQDRRWPYAQGLQLLRLLRLRRV